jgi:hypothetical protein
MRILNFKKVVFLALALTVILACNSLSGATPQPAATLNALYTSAVETLNAMSTQGAVSLTQQPSPTSTLSIPTTSPIPLQTFTVVPVQPSTRCDAAAFIADVTYPDGSSVGMGVAFTKTWRIKNIGICSWTTSYALVFVSGEKFGAQNSISMPGNVGPGQTVDLSVQLTAPNHSGHYTGNWMLRNASGVLFGVGDTVNSSIYVDVNTSGYAVLGYDFIDNYCEALWSNASQDLPCPGTEGDNRGFVLVQNSPKMEDGSTAPNKGLMTFPQGIKDGLITGKYPGVTIQSGDRFQAWINCMYKANDCNMIYKLQYQIGKGTIQTLGQWNEVYEGQYYAINIDLSALNGQKVKFILTVLANGSPHEDYALWIAPRITRLSAQPPTATSTSSPSPTVTATATRTATPGTSYP